MATTIRGLWSTALRCQCRAAGGNSTRQLAPRAFRGQQRFISASSRVWADGKGKDVSADAKAPAPEDSKANESPKFDEEEELRQNLLHLERKLKDELSGPDIAAMLAPDTDDLADTVKRINNAINDVASGLQASLRMPAKLPYENGLLSEGEEEEPMSDPDFKEDDISSLGHAELEQHRELRQYARIAAWEMPLLAKLSKPFVPPTKQQILRFRYTSYLGEQHPAEKKVVVEFCPAEIPRLKGWQVEKLIKLLGVRYNPATKIAKMSCESFETEAQNKRYLGDLIQSLIKEAQDATDKFEDVPYDARHYEIKTKVKPKFPKEWRVSTRRREELQKERDEAAARDQIAAAQGKIFDGVSQIEQGLASAAIPEVIMVNAAIPDNAAASAAAAAKQPRLTVRR